MAGLSAPTLHHRLRMHHSKCETCCNGGAERSHSPTPALVTAQCLRNDNRSSHKQCSTLLWWVTRPRSATRLRSATRNTHTGRTHWPHIKRQTLPNALLACTTKNHCRAPSTRMLRGHGSVEKNWLPITHEQNPLQHKRGTPTPLDKDAKLRRARVSLSVSARKQEGTRGIL